MSRDTPESWNTSSRPQLLRVSLKSRNLLSILGLHIASVIIQAPQLDINTVAAGGGSRLFYRHGMFVVGPEVSSDPRPSCIYANPSHSPRQLIPDRLVTGKKDLSLLPMQISCSVGYFQSTCKSCVHPVETLELT